MSRALRFATGAARRWVDAYTRDLDPAVRDDRRAELRSDVWEQSAAEAAAGVPPHRTAARMLARVARGVPADLSWRRERGSGRPGMLEHFTERASVPAAIVLGVLILSLGAAATARISVAALRGEFLPSDLTVASTLAGTLGMALGLLLIQRRLTRWMGMLWLAGSSAIVLPFGSIALVTLSVTAGGIQSRLLTSGPAWWTVPALGVAIAVPLYFAVQAAFWAAPGSTEEEA